MNVKEQRKDMTDEQVAALDAWERESEAYLTVKGHPIGPLLEAQRKCRELAVPGFPAA